MKNIYLDNSVTTRPSDQAISAMMLYLTEMWGAPTAPHPLGQQLYPSIKESYRALYALLGAKDEDTIFFTASGAEAVNTAIFSAYQDVTLTTGKNQFLTSAVDEAPTVMSIERLETMGCVGNMIEVNSQGVVTPEALGDAITPRTAMLSLSWGNGLTGVIQPVKALAALCKERGILFHLDATHVLGKLYFDLEDVNVDFISFNGDQLHAPKGTGALYFKNGVKCKPLILGGSEQGGYRGGTLNVAGLVALSVSAKEAMDCRDLLCTEVARLRDRLEAGIVEGFPEAIPFFRECSRLPNCSAIGFPGIGNEALLFLLSRKGICASIGGGGFQQIGLVLEGAGIEGPLAHSAINFSLSRETTEEEIEAAIPIIVNAAKQLSKTSQYL